MTRSVLPRVFAFLFALLFAACAKAPDTLLLPVAPEESRAVWERFDVLARRAENTVSPFRLNATLYYSGNEENQRVTTYFWSNGERNSPYPLRLDILMGPGSVVASAREDANGLFIHVPREQTLYFAQEDGLLAFGVPLPFTLRDLAALVTGKFSRVFLTEENVLPPAFQGQDGTTAYLMAGVPLSGYLYLSDTGLPVAWEDGTRNGWRLTLEYWPDSTRKTPRKLYIEKPGENRRATLVVRELDFPPAPFTSGQLELTIPVETRLAPLDGAR